MRSIKRSKNQNTPLSLIFANSQPCKPRQTQLDNTSSIEDKGGEGTMTDQWSIDVGSGPTRRRPTPNTAERNDKHRWSTYTADTSITALESSSDDSFARLDKKDSIDDSFNSFAGSSRSRSPSPRTDETIEDTINTALTSMLSTANDLLMSTISARSDLARLQLMENHFDAELDRREERILTEIQNNERMSQWIDDASTKLDRMLAQTNGSNKRSGMRRAPSILTPWSQEVGPSDSNSKHWRATSTTSQINKSDANLSVGLFEAKDENATISKSAAKRLEKMLQRANSSSNIDPNKTITKDTKPSELLPPISPGESPQEGLLSPNVGMSAASSSTIIPIASPSFVDAGASSISGKTSTSASRGRSPSIASESGPSSVLSSRDEDVDQSDKVALDDTIDPEALLTPPTPFEDLASMEELKAGLSRRSLSSLRSPSSAVKSSGNASNGSYVSEAALGQMVLDEDGNASTSNTQGTTHSKGALEALRKLNHGSSQSNVSTSQGWGGSFASWVGMSSSNTPK